MENNKRIMTLNTNRIILDVKTEQQKLEMQKRRIEEL